MTPSKRLRRWLPVVLIMAGVLLWGIVHAAGSFLFNYDPRKPLIVMVCTLFFLGFWGAALFVRGLFPRAASPFRSASVPNDKRDRLAIPGGKSPGEAGPP